VAESFICIVEIPKGSRNKYEYDHESGGIRLDRFLFSSVVYPTDYGFVPDTLSLDGDPLDVMVLVSEPTFPGCRVRVRPIGVLWMHDEEGNDAKVLCVALDDPDFGQMRTLDDVNPLRREEIEHFFKIYKELEPGKSVEIRGWADADDAMQAVADAAARFTPPA
jgi:inorganic pyrophosphatase